MRAAAVEVGGVYWAKVGETKVQVRVVYANRLGRTARFAIARLDNNKVLPSLRTAAALHPRLELWTGCMEPQDTP